MKHERYIEGDKEGMRRRRTRRRKGRFVKQPGQGGWGYLSQTHDTEEMRSVGAPIWVSTLSSHCRGPCK